MGLGEIERLLFAYVGMTGRPVVRSGDLLTPLQLTPTSERNLLSRLAKAGWIARVRPWIPTLPKRGTVDRRWGVVINGDA